MSATLMHGVIDQIQRQAQLVGGSTTRLQNSRGETPSFSDVLFNSINEINKTQVDTKSKTQQWMSGSQDIALNDVMLAMQKSSISFSFGMQARNKMIGAYQEIMNTPV